MSLWGRNYAVYGSAMAAPLTRILLYGIFLFLFSFVQLLLSCKPGVDGSDGGFYTRDVIGGRSGMTMHFLCSSA